MSMLVIAALPLFTLNLWHDIPVMLRYGFMRQAVPRRHHLKSHHRLGWVRCGLYVTRPSQARRFQMVPSLERSGGRPWPATRSSA
jgi:hypothetical protein